MFPQQNGFSRTASVTDAGLAAHMRQVFNYMTGGVALSGAVAWFTLNSPALMAIAANPVTQILFMVIWIGFAFLLNRIVFSLQPAAALGAFAAYSALAGFALSPLVALYTGASVAVAFFTAAIMFGGASLFGYVTNKSLSGWGNFLMIGMWGLLAAVVINMVLGLFGIDTGPLGFITSLITVPLVAAVTAYETNQLREMYVDVSHDDVLRSRVAVMGAVSLYISFVVLFINLLQLLGVRNNE